MGKRLYDEKGKRLEIAKERIEILLGMAKTSQRSERYTRLLEKIAKKYRIDISDIKKHYCRHCYKYFVQGGYKTRIKNGKRVIICSCGGRI